MLSLSRYAIELTLVNITGALSGIFSLKVLGARKDGAALPLVNKTMMYF